MGNSNGSKKIHWGYILLSAVASAIIAMGIVYGIILPIIGQDSDLIDQICPLDDAPCPEPDTSGDFLADLVQGIAAAFACAFIWFGFCLIKLSIWAMLIYLPLSALIAALIIRRWVEHRRTLHVVLAVILSLPLAFGILWLVAKLFG